MRRLLLVTLTLALAASLGTVACGGNPATGGSGGKGGTGGTGGSGGTAGSGGSGGGGSGGTDIDPGIRPCGRYSNQIKLDADLAQAAILPKAGENPARLDPSPDSKPFYDPFFGTAFVRLTSLSQGGQKCHTPTYGQNAISLDSHWVMVWCQIENDVQPRLLAFDPEKLKVTANTSLFTVQAANGFYPEAEDARFSGSDPDLMFLRQVPEGNPQQPHNRVWRYSMSSRVPSNLKSFDSDVDPKTDRIEQLSMSADNKIIAVARVDRTTNAVKGYVVANTDDPTATKSVLVDKLERVRLDRSGRYLFLTLDAAQPSQPSVRVVDLESGTETDLRATNEAAPDPDRFELGSATELGYGKFSNDVRLRDLSTPDMSTVLIPKETFGVFHPLVINFSVSHPSEAHPTLWGMLAFQGATNTPYANELDLVTLDGSRPNPDGFQKVYRLAHHRADSDPHATLSPDGCLIAFTSRFTPVEQEHVYLLVIPKL